MPWYFAYGSNLDPAQLADREVEYADPQRVRLHGWRLAFNKVATLHAVAGEGRANIVPARRHVVEGAVFRVEDAALANLDWYEGARSGHYRRAVVHVTTVAGAALEAVTYVAAFTGTGLKPSPWYLRRILTGARHFGLSAEYIAHLEQLPTVGPLERPTA